MTLEQQSCTLDQARKLKTLGIRQGQSYAAWIRNESLQEAAFRVAPAAGIKYASPATKKIPIEGFAGYTSAELEEMLFAYYFSGHAFKSNDKWGHTWGHLKNGGDRSQPIMSWHPTAAQARAEMLIHLLQGGSLSAGQVNERLFENNTQ
jgi:hypothetical protein